MLHYILNPLSNKIKKSDTCRDKPHAPEALKHPTSSQKSTRHTERGNVFFTLFGAVAVVGVLGAGIMQTMQGPLNTMVQVNLRERAKIEMSIASKLILLESTDQTDSGDCDADGFVEPIGYTTNIVGLIGGGELPTGSQQDPWGNDYGYCSWDAGDTTGTCGGAQYASLLDGDAPTEASNYSVIAIISAGPDGVFQTTCADHPALDTPGGDDLVENYTYDTAIAGSGGLWSIKSGTPTSAEIDKNLDLTATSPALGGFSPQLLLGARSLILPTQSEASTCDGANDKILRIKEATASPVSALPVVQICDFAGGSGWVSVAAGAAASSLADDDTTVLVDDSAPSIVFEVNGTEELTITPTTLDAGSLNIDTSGTLTAGATTISGNTGITGTFDVNGATTLDALTASGATNINGALTASGGATISGGGNPSLTVTGNIAATDLNPTGDLNLGNTESVNWGDTSVNITGDVGTDSLVFAANAVTMDGALSITNVGLTDPALNVTGNADISGDLDVTGDLNLGGDTLSLGTLGENDEGRILIGQYDGADSVTAVFSSETVDGDATLASDGTLTIQNDAITAAKIIDGAVTEPKLSISNGANSGDCLKYVTGVLTWQSCSGGGGGDGVGASSTLAELLDNTPNGNDGGAEQIRNIADPTLDQDAATKKYVDDTLGALSSDRIQDDDGNTSIDVDITNDGLTDSIVFSTAGSQRMSIDAAGDVFLPGGSTFVQGINSGGATSLTIVNSQLTTTSESALGFRGGGSGGLSSLGASINQGWDAANNDNAYLRFLTAGSGSAAAERLRIAADGEILIGTSVTDESAILNVASTTQGFLPPRMTEAERNAINSGTFATGLVIYNTDINSLELWDGTEWVVLGNGGDSARLIDADDDTSIQVDTAGDGSANTTLFTNATAETMRITASGDVGIGTAAPVTKLDVNGGIRVGSVSGADAPTYLALGDLRDTDVASAADGQFLIYNTGSGNWEATTFDASTSVADDSLDWAQFIDAMTLDATTTIDMDTNAADLNFDSDTFVIDSANNRIGIGISPAEPLSVSMSTNEQLTIYNSAQSDGIRAEIGIDTANHGVVSLYNQAGIRNVRLNSYASSGFTHGLRLGDVSFADNSSLLHMESTTQGFLAPRMTTVQRDAISAPASSLLVFNLTENEYQFNAGTSGSPDWQPMSGATCADSTPDGFDFTNLSNQVVSTLVTSNILQITGLSCAVGSGILGEGSPQLRTCSDATCATVIDDWSSSAQINENDYVQIRLTSSSIGGATLSASVTIGNATDSWSVSTAGGDCSVASPAIGTVCADGTLFAGTSPDGNVRMFTTRCDVGFEWNGSACVDDTGVANGLAWSIDNTANTGVANSTSSGLTNTYAINALTSANPDFPFPAASYCANFGGTGEVDAGGHTDWYLPASSELSILRDNSTELDMSGGYFHSTEGNSVGNIGILVAPSGTGTNSKTSSFRVRCTRRDGATPPATPPGGADGQVQYNDGGALGGDSLFVWDDVTKNLAIGATSPDPSSILDITSTTQGLLPPRMTTAERDAINGGTFATGLMVYNTTTSTLQYYDGTDWQNASAAGALNINDLGDAITDYVTDFNMFMGDGAGAAITVGGQRNLAIGQNAAAATTIGDDNIALGYNALAANINASNMIAIGQSALDAYNGDTTVIASRGNMIAIGANALGAATDGRRSLAIGTGALGDWDGTAAVSDNVAIGHTALGEVSGGHSNAVLGAGAGGGLTASTASNTFMGRNAGAGVSFGQSNTQRNVFIGTSAGAQLETNARDNVAVGYNAGSAISGLNGIGSGRNNILIGTEADVSANDASYELNIGSVLFGNIDDAATTGVDETSLGIGVADATAIDLDAILELDSTTRGLLMPRMTTVQRDAIDNDTVTVGQQVTTGLTVYNTDTNTFDFFDGTAWASFATASGSTALLQDADPDTSINVDTAGDGTDNTIVFTNNAAETMRIASSGNVGIGTASPGNELTVNGDIRSDSIILNGAAGDAPTYITQSNLDWDSFVNAMTLDTTTTIDMDTNTADLNFDDDTFVIDSGANSVGIGTDTPAGALDVTGGAGSATLITRASDLSVPFFEAYGDLDGNPNAPLMSIRVGNSSVDRIDIQYLQEEVYHSTGQHNFFYNRDISSTPFNFTNRAVQNDIVGTGSVALVRMAGQWEQTGTGAMDALFINPNIVTTGDGTSGSGNNLLRLSNTDVDRFVVDIDGKVGIGTAAPDDSASLDITSTTAGFLAPRMTTTERDAINSGTFATGLMVYNTTTNTLQYYDGTDWQNASAAGGLAIDDLSDAAVNLTENNFFLGHEGGPDTGTNDTQNTGIGIGALDSLSNSAATSLGDNNTAVGYNALTSLTTGHSNTALGTGAGDNIQGGLANTAVGTNALSGNASRGTAVGAFALSNIGNSSASNSALGSGAARYMRDNSNDNVFIGNDAGRGNLVNFSYEGDDNVIIGTAAALDLDETNDQNTIIGSKTAASLTGGGSGNILIGYATDVTSATSSNELNIGSVLFGNIDDAATAGVDETQFGVGVADATAIDASALVEFDSTTRGFLAPRMTTAERDAINGGTFATGLMVYNITTNFLQYYDGTDWQNASAGGGLAINDLSDATTDYATDFNFFMGSSAGASILSGGERNLAIGQNAAAATTIGDDNIAIGYNALAANINARRMVAIGSGALESYNADRSVIPSRSNMLAIGHNALNSATDGRRSVAIGSGALDAWDDSSALSDNLAIGNDALGSATTGQDNTVFGADGGLNLTSSVSNTFIGNSAGAGGSFGQSNTMRNVFIGSSSGEGLETDARDNIAIGYNTGSTNNSLNGIGSGRNNILIGSGADVSANDASYELNIGNTIFGDIINAASDGTGTAFIGINNNAPDVALDVTGDIEYTGTITDVSDRRLKTDITPFNTDEMINKIAAIDTYSFTMKSDPAHRTEFGVMAQELENIFPELVHTAKDEMGTKSVNYVGLIAPMIEATKSLKAENDTLKAELAAMKSNQDDVAATLASIKNDMAGLKIHTGFGMEKASVQSIGLMLLMMLFGGACVMIATRIKRIH